MSLKRIILILSLLSVALFMSGCGDSGSNATLSMSEPVATVSATGLVTIDVTASVTPAKSGVEVSFTARQYQNDGTGMVEVPNTAFSRLGTTGPSGTTPPVQPYFMKQTTGPSIVIITASIEGRLPVSKTVEIDQLVL